MSRKFLNYLSRWIVAIVLVSVGTPIYAASSNALTLGNDLFALLKAEKFSELEPRIEQIQHNYEAGKISDLDLIGAYRNLYGSARLPASVYDHWVARYPDSYAAYLVRGETYKILAHAARGGAFTKDTPASNLAQMDVYYRKAYPDIAASFKLAKKPVVSYVILLDMLNNVGTASRKRQVIDEALGVAPDSYILRRKYMHTLETRWGGSPESMAAFYKECIGKGLTVAQMNVLEGMVYADKGWVSLQSRDSTSALNSYNRAVELIGKNSSLMDVADSSFSVEVATAHQNLKDYTQAIVWYTKSIDERACDCAEVYAKRGFSLAQLNRTDEAIKDYQIAASRGNAWAQNQLGEHYWHGVSVPVDKVKARDLFKRAADQGYEPAKKNLAWAMNG